MLRSGRLRDRRATTRRRHGSTDQIGNGEMNMATSTRIATAALLSGGMLVAASVPAAAQPSFYEGKRINVVIGFAAGGTADADGRLIAQHLGRHIPGKPTMIAQNEPGAGGVKSIN